MRASVAHVKAFLLDWDGTLIDSLPIKIENAAQLFADRLGADGAAVKASYAYHSGVPRRELFDRIAEECLGRPLGDAEFSGLSDAFSAANRSEVVARGALRDGVDEALQALQADGCLLFVSTSAAQDEIGALGVHYGLDAYCQELLGSRPGFSKGPEHAAYISAKYDVPVEQIAGVGDEATDVRLHRAAGIFSVGVVGTEEREALVAEGADRVIEELSELVPLAAC